jgi:hypothetical protein
MVIRRAISGQDCALGYVEFADIPSNWHAPLYWVEAGKTIDLNPSEYREIKPQRHIPLVKSHDRSATVALRRPALSADP